MTTMIAVYALALLSYARNYLYSIFSLDLYLHEALFTILYNILSTRKTHLAVSIMSYLLLHFPQDISEVWLTDQTMLVQGPCKFDHL
jgi:hypothetical protein